MIRLRTAWAAVAVSCTVLVGCSASSSEPGGGPPASTPSVDASAAARQKYVDAVNQLCDALLPKIISVTHGGNLDIPLNQFFQQLPAHQRLRDNFDRDLAKIPVPPAAKDAAAAFAAYIKFANDLDARRLKAARHGPAAYHREIQAEMRSASGDPSIAARNAAGFHDSCNAR